MRSKPRSALCGLVLALVLTASPAQEPPEPLGAERAADEDNAVRVPEPLVFDLVRGLGADRGELEANVLVAAPLSDAGDRPVDWAPEVEWAFRDGMAIEFELPFEDDELDAYKVAAQFTIGVGDNARFIHGTQVIVEAFDESDVQELSALYIPAGRFGRVWSAIALVGLRASTGSDSTRDPEVLLNPSVFADVGRRLSIGLEVNLAAELGGDADTRVIPQVHWEIVDAWMLQAGPSVRFRSGETDHDVVFRLVWSD